jgi:hypothetical protein
MKSYPRQLLATIIKNAALTAIEKEDRMYGRQLASILEKWAKELRAKFGRREVGMYWCVTCRRSYYHNALCGVCGGELIFAESYGKAKDHSPSLCLPTSEEPHSRFGKIKSFKCGCGKVYDVKAIDDPESECDCPTGADAWGKTRTILYEKFGPPPKELPKMIEIKELL